MSELIGRKINDQYYIQAFLGRGGMSEVYKVWDSARMSNLAIKVLLGKHARNKTLIEQFRQEATTLRDLEHRHIVRYYGLETSDDLVCILMDYIDGYSLQQILRHQKNNKSKLSNKSISAIMKALCSAFNYAHEMGYVHRDLKPSNILVDKKGGVYLADFGIASSSSGAGKLVGAGTPAYMAPEQIRGEKETNQTDIYSLGVVLYEILTGGQRPFTGARAKFRGSTGERIRWEQENIRPLSPSSYNPDISRRLEKVVMRCLEKDPRNRYRSTLELLNALSTELGSFKDEYVDTSDLPTGTERKKPPPPPPPPGDGMEERSSDRLNSNWLVWGVFGVVVIVVLFLMVSPPWDMPVPAINLSSGDSSGITAPTHPDPTAIIISQKSNPTPTLNVIPPGTLLGSDQERYPCAYTLTEFDLDVYHDGGGQYIDLREFVSDKLTLYSNKTLLDNYISGGIACVDGSARCRYVRGADIANVGDQLFFSAVEPAVCTTIGGQVIP